MGVDDFEAAEQAFNGQRRRVDDDNQRECVRKSVAIVPSYAETPKPLSYTAPPERGC